MDQSCNNEYSLYIPRATLSISSGSSSNKSLNLAKNRGELSGESETEGIGSNSAMLSRKRNQQMYYVHKVPRRTLNCTQSSSSSSSASNKSNYSANSYLLNIKNLENFNRKSEVSQDDIEAHRSQMIENIRQILAIDNPNFLSDTKEVDQMSTTSSAETNTNFTVITCNDCEKSKKSRAICRRQHKVTLLIIVMTFLLFVGISSAVCMLEMRYQKMPR